MLLLRPLTVQVGQTYTASTYNIIFGAYTPDYTFFMDVMARNVGTHGRKAVSRNSDVVLYTTTVPPEHCFFSSNGGTAPDFLFFSMIDTSSGQSWHANQVSEAEPFGSYASYLRRTSTLRFSPIHHRRISRISNSEFYAFKRSLLQVQLVVPKPIDESFSTKILT